MLFGTSFQYGSEERKKKLVDLHLCEEVVVERKERKLSRERAKKYQAATPRRK